MSLTKGTRVGPYEVGAAIGEGGMGRVYCAHDTKLNRDVALKILPDGFVHDAERLARFRREAQVLASLNHPNVAHVYGVEDSSVGPALVMELVDGHTLDELIAGGHAEAERQLEAEDENARAARGRGAPRGLKVDQAMTIARQIADALDAAHEHGVIHRDLKPANVKVKDDGTVKVLDFGLAKPFGVEGASGTAPGLSNSPTLTSPAATAFGTILGTAAYMSPEQARGRAVDKRADIWAFGCVLYEMLTGKSAFPGDDVAETIGAVIHKEPDWTALPADTPPNLRVVVERCLRKDPRQRLRDIGDVRLALDGAFVTAGAAPSNLAPASVVTRWRSVATFCLLGLALAVTSSLTVWALMRPVPPAIVRLTAPHPGPDVGGTGTDIAVSRDGRRIVYLAGPGGRKQIYTRTLDQLVPTRLGGPGPIPAVFLSPDGQWVGFTDATDRSIKKISVSGGGAVTIAKELATAPLAPIWLEGDRIVFTQVGQFGPGLLIVPAAGGKPEPLLVPDGGSKEMYSLPGSLPGGMSILLDVYPPGPGSYDAHRIEVLDLRTKARRVLVQGGARARYATSGHLVYLADEVLRAVRFDLNRLEVVGPPVPVVEGVMARSSGIASYDVSDTGTLVYLEGSLLSAKRTVVWVDRHGREEPIALPPRAYAYVRLSPDETKLALDIRDEQNDIWIWDLGRKTLTRLTFDPGLNRGPVWSPDGSRVAFSSGRGGVENVQWQLADGSSAAEPLTTIGRGSLVPRSFSPDGSKLVVGPGAMPFDLQVLNIKGPHTIEPLLGTSFNENTGEISPDGRWIAYSSDESGRNEIYVRPFPAVNAARWQVSSQGGTRPMWARNGRELFYSTIQGFGALVDASANAIMAVPFQASATFAAGTPAAVVAGAYLAPQAGRNYDASKDGRFLVIKDARTPEEMTTPPHIVVVQNWFEDLKKLAP